MEKQKDLEQLGEQMRLLREAKGWTQLDLSYETGIDPGYISKIERAKTEPGITMVIVIARALECKIDDLIKL
jgi:transcriptional regulator with XRE-family HTH domain